MRIMPKCPYCGESYYAENYSTTTAMYWAPIYKNGVLMNENPNITTTHCTCCNCGKSFSYTNKEYEKMQTSLDCTVSRENASLTEVSVL